MQETHSEIPRSSVARAEPLQGCAQITLAFPVLLLAQGLPRKLSHKLAIPGIFLGGEILALQAGNRSHPQKKNNYCINRSSEFFPRVLIADGQARSGGCAPTPIS